MNLFSELSESATEGTHGSRSNLDQLCERQARILKEASMQETYSFGISLFEC